MGAGRARGAGVDRPLDEGLADPVLLAFGVDDRCGVAARLGLALAGVRLVVDGLRVGVARGFDGVVLGRERAAGLLSVVDGRGCRGSISRTGTTGSTDGFGFGSVETLPTSRTGCTTGRPSASVDTVMKPCLGLISGRCSRSTASSSTVGVPATGSMKAAG